MKAIEYYQKSADLGDADTKVRVALMYQIGDKIKRDLAKAFALYSEAANGQNAFAMFKVAFMPERGVVQRTMTQYKIVSLYKKAAKWGIWMHKMLLVRSIIVESVLKRT